MKKQPPLACIAAGAITIFGASLSPTAAAPTTVAPATITVTLPNSSFETGNTTPAGWAADGTDATHHLSIVTGGAHTGKRSAKMVADAGGASSFFGYDQYIHVTPGSYTFSAWVKTDKVQGSAGWFYHVYKGHDMIVNNTLNANTTLTDWSQVTATVTVPAGGDTVQIGTSLYGTGTASFDDAVLLRK